MSTEAAFPVFDIQGEYTEVNAGDDGFLALGAENAVALVAGGVADIDVLQALLVGDSGCRLQGVDEGRGQMGSIWRCLVTSVTAEQHNIELGKERIRFIPNSL